VVDYVRKFLLVIVTLGVTAGLPLLLTSAAPFFVFATPGLLTPVIIEVRVATISQILFSFLLI
jgi:hypothetical protein